MTRAKPPQFALPNPAQCQDREPGRCPTIERRTRSSSPGPGRTCRCRFGGGGPDATAFHPSDKTDFSVRGVSRIDLKRFGGLLQRGYSLVSDEHPRGAFNPVRSGGFAPRAGMICALRPVSRRGDTRTGGSETRPYRFGPGHYPFERRRPIWLYEKANGRVSNPPVQVRPQTIP